MRLPAALVVDLLALWAVSGCIDRPPCDTPVYLAAIAECAAKAQACVDRGIVEETQCPEWIACDADNRIERACK
jgi:hypothetical protein